MARRRDFGDWATENTAPLFRRALLLTGDWHRADEFGSYRVPYIV